MSMTWDSKNTILQNVNVQMRNDDENSNGLVRATLSITLVKAADGNFKPIKTTRDSGDKSCETLCNRPVISKTIYMSDHKKKPYCKIEGISKAVDEIIVDKCDETNNVVTKHNNQKLEILKKLGRSQVDTEQDNVIYCPFTTSKGGIEVSVPLCQTSGIPKLTMDSPSQCVAVTPIVKCSTTVTGVEMENLSHQWRQNGEDSDGESSNLLTISSITEDHSGTYGCAVKNECGDYSKSHATLIKTNDFDVHDDNADKIDEDDHYIDKYDDHVDEDDDNANNCDYGDYDYGDYDCDDGEGDFVYGYGNRNNNDGDDDNNGDHYDDDDPDDDDDDPDDDPDDDDDDVIDGDANYDDGDHDHDGYNYDDYNDDGDGKLFETFRNWPFHFVTKCLIKCQINVEIKSMSEAVDGTVVDRYDAELENLMKNNDKTQADLEEEILMIWSTSTCDCRTSVPIAGCEIAGESKDRSTYQLLSMPKKWLMIAVMKTLILIMVTLWVLIQNIGLTIICQPHQVDVGNTKVCKCKSFTANGGRRFWCYCLKCRKWVCLCCAAKDHHVHNHHKMVPVIDMFLSPGSCCMESYLQEKMQCLLLYYYTALLHVLHWNAYYINFMACLILQELAFLAQQDLVFFKQMKVFSLQQELVCLKQLELLNLKQLELLCVKQLELVCLELLNLKQLKLACLEQLELLTLKQPELICLKQPELEILSLKRICLDSLSLKQPELVCLKGQELACLKQWKLVCLKQLELLTLKQPELVCLELLCLKQLELLSLKQPGLICLKQPELVCLESLNLKQKELVCLKQIELLSLKQSDIVCLKQPVLVCLKQQELVCLKQLELVCLERLELFSLKQPVLIYLKQPELVCLELHNLKQQELVQLELLSLKQSEYVCLYLCSLELVCFTQQELACLKQWKLIQSELVCLEMLCLKQLQLVCLKQSGLEFRSLKQKKLVCFKQQELACLKQWKLICSKESKLICLELLNFEQQKLVCLNQQGLACFKQWKLIFLKRIEMSYQKQLELDLMELLSLKQLELVYLKQLELLSSKQPELELLTSSLKQQELFCLELLNLKHLESTCLRQLELKQLELNCLEFPRLNKLELVCLKQQELVCSKQMNLISLKKQKLGCLILIQKNLAHFKKHRFVSWGKELVYLKQQLLLCLIQQELVSMKLPAHTANASLQQQQLLSSSNQQELLYFNNIHITKEVEFSFIQLSNAYVSNNIGCPILATESMLRDKVENVWLYCFCLIMIMLLLLFDTMLIQNGEIVYIKDQDCNPVEFTILEPSTAPQYQYALENEKVKSTSTNFNRRNIQHVLYNNASVKYKTRLKNMHIALQKVSCFGLILYVSAQIHKNVRSAEILPCTATPSVENADKMILNADVVVEVTKLSNGNIGSALNCKSFQLHMCFGCIQLSKQILKADRSWSCALAMQAMNAEFFDRNGQCQIDVAMDESSCRLVVSVTKPAQHFWSGHHELVITRSLPLSLTMNFDVSRPVGKGSDPPASHPTNHQQQKHFISTEIDVRGKSAVGHQTAANSKVQIGVYNDMPSLIQGDGHLDHDVVSDGHRKYNSQYHKDGQLLIKPEGLSLTEDRRQLHTTVVPDCKVKHKFDVTTSTITEDILKDGKGAVDSSTLLQSADTVGNSFAFNFTNAITQNVVKDGRGTVETKSTALLPSTSSVYSSLSSNIPAAQKTVVKSSTVSKAHDSGPQLIKALPTETDHLPPVGLQYNVLYDTNARHEVPMAQDEKSGSFVKQKVDKTIHRHYQKDFPSVTQHKDNAVKNDASKTGVQKPSFPKRCCIVVGNKTFTLDPNLLAHPHMDTYFVKERTETRPGHFLARLVLHHVYLDKNHATNEDITAAQQSQAASITAESEAEKDGGAVTERKHFPLNVNRAGYIVFSSDLTRFSGSMKYPLPSRKATAIKVGKGGNGFVFLIFHSGKEYAVKKTVYRANEIRIHSQLDHPNLVNLDAVLVGEEHERHRGKFYAFCFMPKCNMDLRSVISTKQHGCLKHLKMQLVEQRNLWEVVVVNIKYILKSLLKALEYMHNLGLVHRDVKASNILLKMKCPCTKPLMCSCPQKYVVKLGDFDSSTIVPGFGLKIEPHQMIRYASVLPLGTMGYRAPEVSMHLVISGPYEVLYTTAVDIWSFGCLLLNMLIGKNGPLKQRGEAALLLSAQEQPYSKELYHKTIKVNEVQKYYSDMPEFVDLVYKCLQVDVHCRPSARQLLQLDIMQNK